MHEGAGVLVGPRVRLRPHVVADALHVARWRNDAEVAYWATAGDLYFGPVAPAAVEQWFSEKMPALDPSSDGVFAVELLDARLIGIADYRDVVPRARSATVGITIGEKGLWGQGFGTEALGLLVGFLFGPLNLRRVQLETWSGNKRAQRAFAHLGFQEEGRLRQAVRGPDGYFDRVVMGVLRADWSGGDGPAAPE
jgi:RimJ/RimL family protein N-acetyltransferase